MVFASLTFIYLFLPIALGLYYLCSIRLTMSRDGIRLFSDAVVNRFQNYVLIVTSWVFYAWGEPVWVLLLFLSSLVGWVTALLVERHRGHALSKVIAIVGAMVNLSFLGFFKYADFFAENVNAVFALSVESHGLALPIGISFYTFQIISYVVDVYRGDVQAQRKFLPFLLYVSLFHQLIAGPIVRYRDIEREINHRRHTWDDFSSGLHRVCIGLFKKVFIANIAGEWVSETLGGDLAALSTADAWLGLAMFTIQIYFDFSAYSDIAIGLGLMFGFHYKENFNFPYIARSVSDFWRRWHISLSSFFRDYVYIPLGGGRLKPYRNLLVVWALTGFWHGASWNFVLWGAYFGLFIAVERIFLARALESVPRLISHTYLLFVVMLGWALFYFTDFSSLHQFLRVLFGLGDAGHIGLTTTSDLANHAYWIVLAILCSMPVWRWLTERSAIARAVVTSDLHWLAVLALDIVILMACSALLVNQSYNPFIYFRF